MRKLSFFFAATILFASCNTHTTEKVEVKEDSKDLATFFENYYIERGKLLPIESTQNGDSINNDQLFADFTDSYRAKLHDFFDRQFGMIKQYDREQLSENDKISYDIFTKEMEIAQTGFTLQYFGSTVFYPTHQYMPFDQFQGIPISMGQLGSGESSQPFKSVRDFDNWNKRMQAFSVWADSAIVYFRKGIAANIVLPAALVKKMIPQMGAMVVDAPEKSLFYSPLKKLSNVTADATVATRIKNDYTTTIKQFIVPAYKRLRDFLKTEYLPKARATTGIGEIPNGNKYYDYIVRYWTTTSKTPEEIYQTGLSEVKRILTNMDSVKNAVGFKGDMKAFFEFMKTDKQFMPFKTPEDVLNAFRKIQATIDPNLKKMFTKVPKSPFEIRQTEAFRAASASAEYTPGLPDGSRPGIFYVPILDATTYNTTSGFESLFLHEAIPGHHYQISLQQEDTSLPKFRRFAWYGAYGEGWALYCESLGKELGLYTDPYQYMGALGDEIHRAIRLVVDVGMHQKKMTREEAIKYMMENEAISEQGATAEIERYMAIPGQALSYKVGALKIRELRDKYQKMLGDKFNLAAFHDEILKDGCMQLDVLEKKMDSWAEMYKQSQ